MNILDFIPIGKKNAVTRAQLCILTGMKDRQVRDMIHEARHEEAILNLQDGDGYFRPGPDDDILLRIYVRQEQNRAEEIDWGLQGAKKELERRQAAYD